MRREERIFFASFASLSLSLQRSSRSRFFSRSLACSFPLSLCCCCPPAGEEKGGKGAFSLSLALCEGKQRGERRRRRRRTPCRALFSETSSETEGGGEKKNEERKSRIKTTAEKVSRPLVSFSRFDVPRPTRSLSLTFFREEREQRGATGLSFLLSPPREALSFFVFLARVAEMDESLDAEPRLFVGQVRQEGERGAGRRRERAHWSTAK